MKAIQCFSSLPALNGRHPSGIRKETIKFELPEYLLLTWALSVLQWKKTNGSIKLYTDRIVYDYLDSKNMISLWDEVEPSIDDFYEENPDIEKSIFWAAPKFHCYLKEEAPFVCVDTDLIVWNQLKYDKTKSLMFAHWECIDSGDLIYPPLEKLNAPEGYNYIKLNEEPGKAVNMALTIFHDNDFKNKFTNDAISFMKSNPINTDNGNYATAETIYLEQRLPVMMAKKYNYQIEPLIDCTWSPNKFEFTEHDERYGPWNFPSLDNKDTDVPFTHMWFHKNYLEKTPKARKEYIKSLKKILKESFPVEYKQIVKKRFFFS